MTGDHDVLGTHERKPRCFDTMIQNIILPQIGFALEQKNNAMKGDHDVLETHEGKPRCHWFQIEVPKLLDPDLAEKCNSDDGKEVFS